MLFSLLMVYQKDHPPLENILPRLWFVIIIRKRRGSRIRWRWSSGLRYLLHIGGGGIFMQSLFAFLLASPVLSLLINGFLWPLPTYGSWSSKIYTLWLLLVGCFLGEGFVLVFRVERNYVLLRANDNSY